MGRRISARVAAGPVNLYCITDSLDVVRHAVDLGAAMIQIRAKELTARDLMRLVEQAVAVPGARILVNTRADIALACGATGVHLPADSPSPRPIVPSGFLIGASCHNLEELHTAARERVDFAVFGPVFESPGKGPPTGLDKLREAVRAVRIPLYALGGVTAKNASLCIAAGAHGIAAIRFFRERS